MPDVPVWDVSGWLAEALEGLNLPISEEPMRKKADTSDYITWQQTSRANRFASGRLTGQSVRVAVSLWALPDSDWQQGVQAIANALSSAGAASVRPGTEVWHPDLGRRQALIYALLKRQVQ